MGLDEAKTCSFWTFAASLALRLAGRQRPAWLPARAISAAGLQRREPADHRLVVSPNWRTCLRATYPRRWSALPKGSLLGAQVDVRVAIRRGEVDLPKPAADHVDLDAGFQ